MINSTYSEVFLSEISSIYSGFAFKSKDLKSVLSDSYPVIKIANIQNKEVRETCSESFPKNLFTKKLNKYILEPHDFLIAMTGAGSVGKVGKMVEISKTYLVNQRVAIVRTNADIANPEYVFHCISQDIYEKYLYEIGLGAGQPNISPLDIGSLRIPFPSLEIQKKISKILTDIQKQIGINNKLINLLENISSLLYREWFVEFRFPGYEKIKLIDSEFGQIPEGWKVIKAKDVLSFKKGFEPGSNEYVNREVDSDYVSFYRVGDLENNGKSTFYIKKDVEGIKLCDKKDILLSLDGSLGKVAIGLNGAYSSGIRKVVSKNNSISNGFVYFWLKSKYVQDMINTYAKGSTILHAGNVINYLELAYNEKVYEEFAKLIDPIFELILNLQMQNKALESIRDLLLPKLMSGEIDVSKLDININEK